MIHPILHPSHHSISTLAQYWYNPWKIVKTGENQPLSICQVRCRRANRWLSIVLLINAPSVLLTTTGAHIEPPVLVVVPVRPPSKWLVAHDWVRIFRCYVSSFSAFAHWACFPSIELATTRNPSNPPWREPSSQEAQYLPTQEDKPSHQSCTHYTFTVISHQQSHAHASTDATWTVTRDCYCVTHLTVSHLWGSRLAAYNKPPLFFVFLSSYPAY